MTSRHTKLRSLLAQVGTAPASPARERLLRELRKRVAELEGPGARTSGFRGTHGRPRRRRLEDLLR